MWGEESFSMESFSTDSWLFWVEEALRRYRNSLFLFDKLIEVNVLSSNGCVSVIGYR